MSAISSQQSVRTAQPTREVSWFYWLWILALVIVFGTGIAAGAYVVINGLGVTNLTDELPWGLWITVDLSAIGLGAGAFTLSAAVYLFGLKRYEAIARAAVLVGFLGYTSAMMALFLDIGRPDRFYHPLIYWNVHSVLWEITMCVILYATVLIIELLPIVIESTFLKRFGWLVKLAHWIHNLMPVVALLGMGLSLLHQSSLGATYGILTARPVWYSPASPVLFILSAVAAGVSLTLFITLFASMISQKQLVPPNILRGVAWFIAAVVLGYLYLKLWSWAATNYYSQVPEQQLGLEILRTNTPYNYTFWFGEVLFGALIPAVILIWGRLRRNPRNVMVATFMIIVGLVINRWNMTLSGFVVPLDWLPGENTLPPNSYAPNLIEYVVSAGIVAYSWLVYSLAVRFINLYPDARPLEPGEAVHIN
jgi:Ni/Fe-hydrogenase subunit HybB-like protein